MAKKKEVEVPVYIEVTKGKFVLNPEYVALKEAEEKAANAKADKAKK